MCAKQVLTRVSLAVLLVVATSQAAMAQQVVAVYFEDLGFGSAMSYVFAINSATQAPIGTRTVFIPQGHGSGTTTSFAWQSTGHSITLAFASTTDVITVTGYDPNIDVLFFTRSPGYWAGCRSPYIPQGIPYATASYLCSLVK